MVAVASPLKTRRPSPLLVQGSLVICQVLFGLGSVIAALGLPACNPFAFALYREIAAGFLLWLWSQSSKAATSDDDDNNNNNIGSSYSALSWTVHWKRFAWLGLAIFGNQAGVIVGIKLAGPVTAAVWQPSQPILTAAISMLLGWEPPDRRRIAGVFISFVGCATMVILSANNKKGDNNQNGARGTVQLLVGNFLFFVNCLSTSLYVILSKQPLRLYPPLTVVAWSYNIAAVFMAVTAFASAPLLPLICPDCTGVWTIPPGAAVWALVYFVVFNSVAAYAILTWANQFATGTLVMGYSVLQPVTAAALTAVLLYMGIYPTCVGSLGQQQQQQSCLDPPDASALFGMVGVLGGLGLVILTEPTKAVLGGKASYKEVPHNYDWEEELLILDTTRGS
jgi:drug/metabolite transporter (DMT)-like permease